jgi:amino acid permease
MIYILLLLLLLVSCCFPIRHAAALFWLWSCLSSSLKRFQSYYRKSVYAWNMLCEQPYFQRLGCLIDILLLLSCGSNILIIKTLILCGDFFNKKQLLFFFVTFALILSLFFYIYILSKERHSVEKLKLKHKIIRERPQLEQVLKKEKKKRLRMYI